MIDSNQKVVDPSDIANLFNDHFINIASKYDSCNLSENSKTISDEKLDAFISSKLPENVKFEIPFVSTDVVLIQLLSLDESKATGIDNTSTKVVS